MLSNHACHDLENVDPNTGQVSTVRPLSGRPIFGGRKETGADVEEKRTPFFDLTWKSQISNCAAEGRAIASMARPVAERHASDSHGYERPVPLAVSNVSNPLFLSSDACHVAGPTVSTTLRKMR
ncbi:hypothetical protein VaNZ11_000467 [Volvox africanus]|uniref:Uncharacterized protein n=1 Tax=Volvox africanus TaxID=51714 RepID=A0ABQ5RN26_9CHLO|nr:hypothetical protein VaNZ11_000467 [Volvox africanus]